MNVKKLQSAIKAYEQIKVLDAEIIEIEKYAMKVANGETETNLCLNITDLTKKAEEENKVEFDEDGSLTNKYTIRVDWGSHLMGQMMGLRNGAEKEKKQESKYKADLSENATLQIFGILLYEKQSKRAELMKKLERIGVAI